MIIIIITSGKAVCCGSYNSLYKVWKKLICSFVSFCMHAADLKDKLNYKFGDTPAAFWMKFETFLEVFTNICFCHYLPPQQRKPFPLQPLYTPRAAPPPTADFVSQSHAMPAMHAMHACIQGCQEENRCVRSCFLVLQL